MSAIDLYQELISSLLQIRKMLTSSLIQQNLLASPPLEAEISEVFEVLRGYLTMHGCPWLSTRTNTLSSAS